jgi:hypothetical protein
VQEYWGYSIRFITIMGSIPNYGHGALTPPPQMVSDADTAAARKPPKGAEAYEKMVERIKGLSAVVDLFVIAEEGYLGVEALLPLVQVCHFHTGFSSGGWGFGCRV